MSWEQIGNDLAFRAFFSRDGVGEAGLTVTVDIYAPDDTLLVSAAAATELGGGLYRYTLGSASVTLAGEYTAIFKSADLTVDQPHVPAVWIVGRAGVENLDAAVSSRLATAGYTAPPSAAAIRIEMDTNSAALIDIATDVTSVLADTAELQADWADGGRLDLILDAILDDTGTSGVAVADKAGYVLAAGGLDAVDTAEPAGLAANFREQVSLVYHYFVANRATMSRNPGQTTLYAADAATVILTQALADDGNVMDRGAAVAG